MVTVFNTVNEFAAGGGLSALQSTLVRNWIGPILLIIVAIFAIKAAWQRELRQFVTLAIIFALAAVFIYFGDTFFGENGVITRVFEKEGKDAIGSGFGIGIVDHVKLMFDYGVDIVRTFFR